MTSKPGPRLADEQGTLMIVVMVIDADSDCVVTVQKIATVVPS
jgi:hypothetical protein